MRSRGEALRALPLAFIGRAVGAAMPEPLALQCPSRGRCEAQPWALQGPRRWRSHRFSPKRNVRRTPLRTPLEIRDTHPERLRDDGVLSAA